jgi:P4 family phage/plasmid primase-like protien
MNPDFQIQYDEERAPRRAANTQLTVVDRTNDPAPSDVGLPTTEAELDAAIEHLFETLSIGETRFQEYYKSIMLLPVEYYGPGSYDKWSKVGFALKNTSPKLFPCFAKFSSQSSAFSFTQVPELYDKWVSWNNTSDGLSHRSILYWARKADPEGYQRVIQETKSHYVDAIIRSPISAEYEFACLLKHCYRDFVCASIRNSLWYEFKDHRWQVTDSGIALRSKISTPDGLYGIFHQEHMATIMNDDGSEQVSRRLKRLDSILTELRRNERKNAIMKEALEVYHDATFLEKLDSKPYITCFTNCVVDLQRDPALGFHRPGTPEDYTSKCTNIPYFPLTHQDDTIVAEIEEFFAQLFPNAELRAYVWQHMAATMVGKVLQQCFYIYLGLGCNGKSKFVRLQEMTLGDLKATVPISMVTSSKRPSTGQATSEVAQLVNIRYAVMQEPSRNDRINEGVLKEITGGDMIQARQLFRESFTFKPKFQLAACMNYLFEGTNENDGGFWRRIRIIEFASYFTDNPVDDDPLRPYQFYLDKDIEEKFERWKLVYAAMLVKHAAVHMGKVDDCPVVMARVEEYRQEQDVFSDFIRCSIQPASHGTLLQTELVEAFGAWWRGSHSKDTRPPSNSDLFTYMNRRFGSKIKPTGAAAHWRGLMLLRPDPPDQLLLENGPGAALQTAEI